MRLTLISLLLLTACAGTIGKSPVEPGRIDGLRCAAACDSKWCWPDFELTRPTILTIKPSVRGMGFDGDAIAMGYDGAGWCRAVMPKYHGGGSWETLLCHEAWHCQSRMGH